MLVFFLQMIQPFRVFFIDFRNSRLHGDSCAGIFPGEKNSIAGVNDRRNQANCQNDNHRDPASRGYSRNQAFHYRYGSFHNSYRCFDQGFRSFRRGSCCCPGCLRRFLSRSCCGLGCFLGRFCRSLSSLSAFCSLFYSLNGTSDGFHCLLGFPFDSFGCCILYPCFRNRIFDCFSSLACSVFRFLDYTGSLTFFPNLPGGGLGQLLSAPIGKVRAFLSCGFHTGDCLIRGAVGRSIGGFLILSGKGSFF